VVVRVLRVVARVFNVVSRVLLHLLGCSGWLLWCCYTVARVFWVVARVLLCGC